MTEPSDYTLHPAYLRGKAAGYEQGWQDAAEIVNAKWERRLRDAAGPMSAVSRDIAAVFNRLGPPPGWPRFVGRARPLSPEQVAEIAALDAVWNLPSTGRSA